MTKRAETPTGKEVLTEAEMYRNLDRLEDAVRSVLKLNKVTQRGANTASTPAKRGELLERLDYIYELAKPKFVMTPREITFDPKKVSLPAQHPQRKSAEKLVKWGFVGRVAPVVTGNKETMTLHEFGDVLGIFLARLSEVTHKPSTKWSPYLTDGMGG